MTTRARRIALGLGLAVALQSLALAGMIGWRQLILERGTEVVLETAPVDPRSLFQGDYVRLAFAISRVPATRKLVRGKTVYVELHRGLPAWRFIALHETLPEGAEPNPDRVFMKAQVTGEAGVDVLLHYGIEAYFVPEGEGLALERPGPGEEVSVLAAVDSRGESAIKAILVNGQPRYEESLF